MMMMIRRSSSFLLLLMVQQAVLLSWGLLLLLFDPSSDAFILGRHILPHPRFRSSPSSSSSSPPFLVKSTISQGRRRPFSSVSIASYLDSLQPPDDDDHDDDDKKKKIGKKQRRKNKTKGRYTPKPPPSPSPPDKQLLNKNANNNTDDKKSSTNKDDQKKKKKEQTVEAKDDADDADNDASKKEKLYVDMLDPKVAVYETLSSENGTSPTTPSSERLLYEYMEAPPPTTSPTSTTKNANSDNNNNSNNNEKMKKKKTQYIPFFAKVRTVRLDDGQGVSTEQQKPSKPKTLKEEQPLKGSTTTTATPPKQKQPSKQEQQKLSSSSSEQPPPLKEEQPLKTATKPTPASKQEQQKPSTTSSSKPSPPQATTTPKIEGATTTATPAPKQQQQPSTSSSSSSKPPQTQPLKEEQPLKASTTPTSKQEQQKPSSKPPPLKEQPLKATTPTPKQKQVAEQPLQEAKQQEPPVPPPPPKVSKKQQEQQPLQEAKQQQEEPSSPQVSTQKSKTQDEVAEPPQQQKQEQLSAGSKSPPPTSSPPPKEKKPPKPQPLEVVDSYASWRKRAWQQKQDEKTAAAAAAEAEAARSAAEDDAVPPSPPIEGKASSSSSTPADASPSTTTGSIPSYKARFNGRRDDDDDTAETAASESSITSDDDDDVRLPSGDGPIMQPAEAKESTSTSSTPTPPMPGDLTDTTAAEKTMKQDDDKEDEAVVEQAQDAVEQAQEAVDRAQQAFKKLRDLKSSPIPTDEQPRGVLKEQQQPVVPSSSSVQEPVATESFDEKKSSEKFKIEKKRPVETSPMQEAKVAASQTSDEALTSDKDQMEKADQDSVKEHDAAVERAQQAFQKLIDLKSSPTPTATQVSDEKLKGKQQEPVESDSSLLKEPVGTETSDTAKPSSLEKPETEEERLVETSPLQEMAAESLTSDTAELMQKTQKDPEKEQEAVERAQKAFKKLRELKSSRVPEATATQTAAEDATDRQAEATSAVSATPRPSSEVETPTSAEGGEFEVIEDPDSDTVVDEAYMQLAVAYALFEKDEERPKSTAYPAAGALLVAPDGSILGEGFSDADADAILSVIAQSGLEFEVKENDWVVSGSSDLRTVLAGCTLYTTLEPSSVPHSKTIPPLTRLIELSGISRVVIGSPDPSPKLRSKGAKELQSAGVRVSLGSILPDDCNELIEDYTKMSDLEVDESLKEKEGRVDPSAVEEEASASMADDQVSSIGTKEERVESGSLEEGAATQKPGEKASSQTADDAATLTKEGGAEAEGTRTSGKQTVADPTKDKESSKGATEKVDFRPVRDGSMTRLDPGEGAVEPGMPALAGAKPEKTYDAEYVVLGDWDMEQYVPDVAYMEMAIALAQKEDGEQDETSSFPNPATGAILVAHDGNVIGEGYSDYKTDAVLSAFRHAGLEFNVKRDDWDVSCSADLRKKLSQATLYVTLEPSSERRGKECPPVTRLIELAGIARVVIGSPDPAPDLEGKGTKALLDAGVKVRLGTVLQDKCNELIQEYAEMSSSKLRQMAREHFRLFGRPMCVFHCRVVDWHEVDSFSWVDNPYGNTFGKKQLSCRDFGGYELAPPADNNVLHDSSLLADFSNGFQEDLSMASIFPWYSQADAVIATLPSEGNGPRKDQSVAARLAGLNWLASDGEKLPPGVERIFILDANDLKDLPLDNDDPNLPDYVDIEAFWSGKNRKPTRIVLTNKLPRQVAELRRKFEEKGVIVETVESGRPIDIMDHLGENYGLRSVLWRAGSWGMRGETVLRTGAFQLAMMSL